MTPAQTIEMIERLAHAHETFLRTQVGMQATQPYEVSALRDAANKLAAQLVSVVVKE